MNKKELLERINRNFDGYYINFWLDTKSNGTVVLMALSRFSEEWGDSHSTVIESFETKEDALRKYPFLKVIT